MHSYNTTLAYETTPGGGVFTTVGSVVSISGPGFSWTVSESSDLADEWKTFDVGKGDAGELTFTVRYGETQNAALFGLARTTRLWKVTFPDGSDWQCSGFMSSFDHDTPEDDQINNEITVKLTGAPTFTTA